MATLEGVEVQLGRATFVVPPISVWCQEQLEKTPAAEDARSQIDRFFDQMLMLLEPNYPELTVEELKRAIPLRDLSACSNLVVRAAGDGLELAPGGAERP